MVEKKEKGLVLVLECSRQVDMRDKIETFLDDQGLPEQLATNMFAASVADVLVRDYGVPSQAVTSMKELQVGFIPPTALLSSFRELAREELIRNNFINQLGKTPEFMGSEVLVVPGPSRVKLVVKR